MCTRYEIADAEIEAGIARDLAVFIQLSPTSALAQLVGVLAGECSHRGIQVLEPLGLVQARLEYVADVEAKENA